MNNEKKKITLFDLLSTIVKRWKLILTTTVTITLIMLIVNILGMVLPPDSSFNLIPDTYKPEVTVILNSTASSGGGLSALVPSSISSMLGSLGQPSNPNLVIVQELIKSNKILDTIAQEFNFYKLYNFKAAPVTLARLHISKKTKLTTDENAGMSGSTVIIRISYEDVDKELATKVLDRLVKLIETEFKRITLERVTTKREFLEEREKIVSQDYEKAKKALADFQQLYGLDLRGQAVNQVQAIARLQQDIYETELKIKASYLPDNDPMIIQMRDQITQKKQLIAELKSGAQSFSPSPAVPLDSVPGLMSAYANLEIEVRIQNEIYGVIRKELEMTKTEEASNAGIFQIINPIELPEVKFYPKRAYVMFISVFIGLFFGIFLAFVIEYLANKKNDPVEGKKLQAIRDMLPFKRRKKQ